MTTHLQQRTFVKTCLNILAQQHNINKKTINDIVTKHNICITTYQEFTENTGQIARFKELNYLIREQIRINNLIAVGRSMLQECK